MTPALITPATPDDVPVLLGLVRALADYEKLASSVVATEVSIRESLFGPKPAAEAIIARVGDEPVGFALWFHNYSTFLGRHGLYLEDLFVAHAWRSQGIGRQLLAEVAAVAVARDCGRMEWSVLDWNEPAIRAYRSIGAVPMDEWTIYRLTGDALRTLAAQAPSGR
jgi:GNAT superfamily N-acetyltransferase